MTSNDHPEETGPAETQPTLPPSSKMQIVSTPIQARGGYLVTDLDGVIVSVDPPVAFFLRMALHRLPGKKLSSFIPPIEREQFEADLKKVSDPEAVTEWRLNFQLRNGKPFPVELSVTLTKAADDQAPVLRWLVRDASTRLRTEYILRKAAEDLEQRFQDRTVEMVRMNKQLVLEIGARKKLEKALNKAQEDIETNVRQRTNQLAEANERLQIELVERKRAEEAAAQRAHELSALHNATSALLTTLELEPLLSQILDAATSAVSAAEKGTLHLIAKDTGQLEMRAMIGYSDPRIQKFSIPGSRGYVTRAVQGRKPLLIHDIQTDPLVAYDGPIQEVRAIRSAVVAPLILEGDVLGALSLESSVHNAFTTDDLRVLMSFATTATAAIHNAQLHAEVQKLAITDSLTGLYNRRGFFELGRREIERARRFGHPLTAIWLDIDQFKAVNDNYGHPAGDRVIRMVAERINDSLREVDILGRYGGDEFVVLLPETDLFTGGVVAERLRQEIAETPVDVDQQLIDVTVSVGIARMTEDIAGLEGLLNKADAAMYQAKQSGGNRVEMK